MLPTFPTTGNVISTIAQSVSLSTNWTQLDNAPYYEMAGVNITTTNNLTTSNSSDPPSHCLRLEAQSDFLPWDNPDNLVSAQTEDLVRRLRDVVVLPILFLIGGPANVINMAVFYRQGLKERINVCLFALSLADGLYLLFNIVLYGEQLHVQFTTKEKYGPIMRFVTNNHVLGFYGFTWVSQVMSAIIASERCFCILQPLRSQTVLRTSTMTAVIASVYVVVVGLYFLVTTRYHLVCARDPQSGKDFWTFVSGQFYLDNQKVIDSLDAFVYGVGLPCVMMAVVMTTTTITAVKLRQVVEWRAGASSVSSSSGVSQREIALTRMLVYNSCFFIVCVCPIALFRLTWLFVPEMNAGRRHHNFFMMFIWAMDMVTYVNATFNIAVYYTMGSRYRQTFWALLGRKGADRASNSIPKTLVTSSANS